MTFQAIGIDIEPFFTFLGTLLWIGRGVDIERNVLIAFDLLLVVLGPLLHYPIAFSKAAA